MSTPSNGKGKDSKRTTREKAAAARAAAEAEQRRRDNLIRIVGGLVILVLVAGIIFFAVKGSQKNNNAGGNGGAGTTIVTDAAIPTGTLDAQSANPWGVPVNSAAGKPTLAIWEDFQCPICANFDKAAASSLEKWASDGTINLVWRVATFLDDRFASTSPNPYSSYRAGMAYGCAIDAKQGEPYRTVVFNNQPATEGDGWSNQQLLDFGKQAGITGDAYSTFESCFNDSKYGQWVTNSSVTFTNEQVPGTPTLYLNGKEVPSSAFTNKDTGDYDLNALSDYIAKNG